MVAVYCDICGKRIDVINEKRFKITGYEYKGYSLDPIYSSEDVCNSCINSINDYISKMKRTIIFTENKKDGD